MSLYCTHCALPLLRRGGGKEVPPPTHPTHCPAPQKGGGGQPDTHPHHPASLLLSAPGWVDHYSTRYGAPAIPSPWAHSTPVYYHSSHSLPTATSQHSATSSTPAPVLLTTAAPPDPALFPTASLPPLSALHTKQHLPVAAICPAISPLPAAPKPPAACLFPNQLPGHTKPTALTSAGSSTAPLPCTPGAHPPPAHTCCPPTSEPTSALLPPSAHLPSTHRRRSPDVQFTRRYHAHPSPRPSCALCAVLCKPHRSCTSASPGPAHPGANWQSHLCLHVKPHHPSSPPRPEPAA